MSEERNDNAEKRMYWNEIVKMLSIVSVCFAIVGFIFLFKNHQGTDPFIQEWEAFNRKLDSRPITENMTPEWMGDTPEAECYTDVIDFDPEGNGRPLFRLEYLYFPKTGMYIDKHVLNFDAPCYSLRDLVDKMHSTQYSSILQDVESIKLSNMRWWVSPLGVLLATIGMLFVFLFSTPRMHRLLLVPFLIYVIMVRVIGGEGNPIWKVWEEAGWSILYHRKNALIPFAIVELLFVVLQILYLCKKDKNRALWWTITFTVSLIGILYILSAARYDIDGKVNILMLFPTFGSYVMMVALLIADGLIVNPKRENVEQNNWYTRFCPSCGARFSDENETCDKCGGKLIELERSEIISNKMELLLRDSSSKKMAVIGFLIPLAGFVYWATWKEILPQRSKSAVKGTIFGTVFNVIVIIIYFFFFPLFLI